MNEYDWYTSKFEYKLKKKLVQSFKKNWVSLGMVDMECFDNPHFSEHMEMFLLLHPITTEMLFGFVEATVLSAIADDDVKVGFLLGKKGSLDKKIRSLINPPMELLIKYLKSDTFNNSMIDMLISENDKIVIGQWDYINARNALKEHIKNKSYIIYGNEVINKLKVEYKKQQEEAYRQIESEISGNLQTGFICTLPTVSVEEIFLLMVAEKYISGNLKDFQAIFANTQTKVKNPVKWLVLHNKKPNKTALFTFIKLMLKLDELPREILRQANQLFVCGKENIFPENYTYPSIDEQKSSYLTHFKQIKQTYFPDFLK